VPDDEIIEGNPTLKRSLIDNYDVRLEWFPRPGEVVSVGAFYKNISDPIERISFRPLGDIVTYTNTGEATVFGFEAEFRKNLGFIDPVFEVLSFGFNFAWIESEVPNPEFVRQSKLASIGSDEPTRPLFDQSPYVLNTDLTLDLREWGSTFTVAFSQSGERLYLVNNANYDVYEQPAPQLDFFYTQRLGEHWRLRFSAKNLLNPEYERIYGSADDNLGALPYTSFTRGMTFGVSLSADF
jgi:outer membrane receptor protein involved in Fe transport